MSVLQFHTVKKYPSYFLKQFLHTLVKQKLHFTWGRYTYGTGRWFTAWPIFSIHCQDRTCLAPAFRQLPYTLHAMPGSAGPDRQTPPPPTRTPTCAEWDGVDETPRNLLSSSSVPEREMVCIKNVLLVSSFQEVP